MQYCVNMTLHESLMLSSAWPSMVGIPNRIWLLARNDTLSLPCIISPSNNYLVGIFSHGFLDMSEGLQCFLVRQELDVIIIVIII
jgi:hypothetical protein